MPNDKMGKEEESRRDQKSKKTQMESIGELWKTKGREVGRQVETQKGQRGRGFESREALKMK